MSNDNYLNDPKLTAYILGELEPAEAAKIETWLETSPEGRAQLEELQATTQTLFSALQDESSATTSQSRISSAIQRALALPKDAHPAPRPPLLSLSAQPTTNNNTGSAVLATMGTVVALLVAGVVCLQSSDSKRATANHPSSLTSQKRTSIAVNETEQERFEYNFLIPPSTRPDVSFKSGRGTVDEFFSKPQAGTPGELPQKQNITLFGTTPSSQNNSQQMRGRGSNVWEKEHRSSSLATMPQPATNARPTHTTNDNYSTATDPGQNNASQLPHGQMYYKNLQAQKDSSQQLSKQIPNALSLAGTDSKALGVPAANAHTPLGWRSQTLDWDTDFRGLKFQSTAPPQTPRGLDRKQENERLLTEVKETESLSRQPHIPAGTRAGLKSHLLRNTTDHSVGQPVDSLMLDVQHEPGIAEKTLDDLSLMVTPQIVISEFEEKILTEQELPALAQKRQSGSSNDSLQTYPYYTANDPQQFFDQQRSLARFAITSDQIQRRKRLEQTRLSLAQQEAYAPIVENEFVSPEDQPYSTFSIDVDTGSYANVRRFLHNNQLPPTNAVRLEELINSFDYEMAHPNDEHPVAITLDSTMCPWETSHQLVRVGIKAKDIDIENRPATSLVFLIDVSGSMKDANKLPLAQAALRLLVEQMREDDRIAIVTYASNASIALGSTDGSQKDVILEKIDSLGANGSTNGEGGMQLAYQVATKNLIKEGSNRILICTDGDFNVGTSDNDGVFKLIEEHRKSGVFLSVLGFGTGNLKDSKLEGIANRGNGHYSYIDRLAEAQNVLVEHLTGTLYTVAKDVKLQLEFNPTKVESYRLLGYENRALAAKDFNNDKVDAGEMGAGHTVTALYEIALIGAEAIPPAGVDAPRYQKESELKQEDEPVDQKNVKSEVVHSEELLFVKLRYKHPQSDESTKLEVPLLLNDEPEPASADLQWAASVASFGMLLRDSKFKGDATWDSLLEQTRNTLKDRSTPERVEFVDLVLRGRGMWKLQHGHESPAPQELLSLEARKKAACDNRYKELLDKFERPADVAFYGDFYEFGFRNGENFLGKNGAPDGHWVYVYPNWYVWGEGQAH